MRFLSWVLHRSFLVSVTLIHGQNAPYFYVRLLKTVSSNIRETVLQLFERHRATPGSPFEESHFLDYLLAEPEGKGAVHNSFSGLRRYNAFIDEVQLQFSICFSQNDFRASYSLNKFVERIIKLQSSRRGSLASLRNQQRYGFGWGSIFVINLFAVAFITGISRISQVLAASLIFLCVLANGAAVSRFLSWRTYQRQLAGKLSAKESDDT